MKSRNHNPARAESIRRGPEARQAAAGDDVPANRAEQGTEKAAASFTPVEK